jgi:hypothetical protein
VPHPPVAASKVERNVPGWYQDAFEMLVAILRLGFAGTG